MNMSGKAGNLSAKQEKALQQLKENVKSISKPDWDDYFLLRWLIARSFDVKKAEKMICESMHWRKKFGADSLLQWEIPEVLKLYYPGGFFGEDKEGFPIWINCLGLMDLKGVLYSANKMDNLKYRAYGVELLYQKILIEQSKRHGKRIDKCVVIFDMEGIGLKYFWKPAMDMFTSMFSLMEANYPETLKKAYIINAPNIFPVLWNIAKVFIHEDTRKRMKVLGKNYRDQLLEDINPDQLPVHWGGTARDPDGDEYCKSKVCTGGKIPEKYYLKNIKENIDTSNFENTTVQRGSSVQLEYDVDKPGSSLRWQFLSEGNDIGFGVFKRTSDERQKKGEMEEIVKSQRVDSHMVPEEGSIILEAPGTYVVRFDNTYSWVNHKKVAYLIDVLPPDQENELEVTEF